MVGAGFSSGREIALFFGDSKPIAVALSSIFMALFALLFLTAGKYRLIPNDIVVRIAIFFSASISLIAMLAGGEYILRTMTGVPLLALIMAILAVIVVSQGIEKIKVANLILVPLIVLSIALIFFQIPRQSSGASFNILKPIMYSGLDVLLGGIVVSKEGEEMNFKEILCSCFVVAVFLFGMLYMLQTIVLADTNSSLMPVFAISKGLNLQAICGVLIASAIFTTLVSSLKIVSDSALCLCTKISKLNPLASHENKPIIVMFCLVVFYPLSFFGFGKIVGSLYPVNSVLGVTLAAVVLTKLIAYCIVNLHGKIRSNCKTRHKKALPNGRATKSNAMSVSR